jgi:hypothetical protein
MDLQSPVAILHRQKSTFTPVRKSATTSLNQAHEHLGKLISKMTTDTTYDESHPRVDMGHIVAHRNRAWARRNCTRDLTDEEWDAFREYPQDLRPIA